MTDASDRTKDFRQLSSLLAKLADGALEKQEEQQLAEVLQRSDAAKAYYLNYLHLHSELAHQWGAVDTLDPESTLKGDAE